MCRRLSPSALDVATRTRCAPSPRAAERDHTEFAALIHREAVRPHTSIRRNAARLDRGAPARDLAGDELGKIVRAPALRRRDLLAEGFEALADIRCVERLAHGLVEPAHDRLRRAFGQEQALPGADFEIEALLARGRDIRQD